MGRQTAALLMVLALVLATTHFLGIGITARNYFAFGIEDILWSESGLLFAALGGLISRKYAFALAVGVLYLGVWGMAIFFLNAASGGSLVGDIVQVNALNMAVSVLAGMAGACLGVFLRNRRRTRAAR
ncbi:hypothetical protein KQ945_03040 [Bacillus subtilis subsp. subtilis]|nr:hypothetical protein [Bacillus subtilis subsp. subtilis]